MATTIKTIDAIAVLLVALLQYGCITANMGGIKATETNEIASVTHDVSMRTFSALEPKLSTDGHLFLVASGHFVKSITVTQRVIDYGDEHMTIGIFPGWNVAVCSPGDYNRNMKPEEFIATSIWCNFLLCGLPTVCSLLECFSEPMKLEQGWNIPALGFVGTYQYEGRRYEKSSRIEAINRIENTKVPLILEGYKVLIDGVEFSDQDGIVSLGRHITPGESVRFKMVSVPKYPICEPAIFEAIMDNEFWVTCKGDQ